MKHETHSSEHREAMVVVPTAAARRARVVAVPELGGVADRIQLTRLGVTTKRLDAQLAAGRWRLVGTAVVLHNGPVTRRQYEQIAMINCGPRAVLTSFTASAAWGLRGLGARRRPRARAGRNGAT